MIKAHVLMTTLDTENEQTGVSPKVATPGTYTSRPYGEFSRFANAIFLLDVSAVSGTGTLDVSIEGYNRASQRWHTVATFPQQTAVSATPLDPVDVELKFTRYRSRWVVAGAGSSFTFSLVAIMRTEEPWR